MAAQFDTLLAADALEDAGLDRTHARAIAVQLDIAVSKAANRRCAAFPETGLPERVTRLERELMDMRWNALFWRPVLAMVAIASATIAVFAFLHLRSLAG